MKTEGIDFSSVFILVNLRLLLVEIQTIFLFIYVCVLGQCTRHFKQVLHPCMLTISSLETDLLQTLPLRTFLSQILTQVMQFPHFGVRGSCNTVSSGASVKTVPRHCAAPYSGVINRLFFPIHPNPPSSATVLWGNTDSFVSKLNTPSATNPVSDCDMALYPFPVMNLANSSAISPALCSVCEYSSSSKL